jgi:ABC-2 type transport system permease protein
MSDRQQLNDGRAERWSSGTPAWWLVLTRELPDLWIGGKAHILILIYCELLGIWAYVLASNSELSLVPPKEMVFETLKATISCSMFICVIIGVDSISGERERATLEGLLLTPTSRRQIVVGKFLAAVSPWPATLVITVPYWHVLSQGDEVFAQTVLWGALMGTIMSLALAGIGILVSLWSNSNKTSMFVGLGLYLFLLLPTQLPGQAQTGKMGALLQQVNPMAATTHFLAKLLVNNRTWEEMWPWFVSPALLCALVIGLLVVYASPGLRLEAGKPGRLRIYVRRVAGLSMIVGLMASLGAAPALALGTQEGQASRPSANGELLQIIIDVDHKVVKAGDPVLYHTVVTNHAAEASPPLTVAMNIINLDQKGGVVDPEDWSPERTQYIERLEPGESAKLAWRVNSILDGDYMVYMVAVPKPAGPKATSHPVASSGIHLTVTPFTRLNPGGVLPYAIGGPVLLLLGIILVQRIRRRGVDTGAPQ